MPARNPNRQGNRRLPSLKAGGLCRVCPSSVTTANPREWRSPVAREYLVWRVRDDEFDWFVLRNGMYERLADNDQGIIGSEVFPGLQLNVGALLAGEFGAVLREQLAANAAPQPG